MRIIYVTSSLPHGKKEAFIIPEIIELKRRGHEVLVVPTYPRGKVQHGDAKPLMDHVVSRPLLSAGIVRTAVRRLAGNPIRALEAFSRLFKSRSAGVLLRNLVVYPKGLWLADLARDWRADHIHAHWSTVPATLALIAGEVSKLPWSITAHRFDIAEDNLLSTKAIKVCFIRAINRRGAREIADRIGPKTSPPSVIHMGVAMPPAAEKEPRPDDGEVPRVVVPANLLEVKGHTYLLEAVRLLADRGVHAHVDFAGEGPLRGELADKVEKLKLRDRVAFLGLLPHDKLLERMRAGDWKVLVLPSIETGSGEKEGIPVSIIEAMSYRVPVVSTATGGIPELFEGVDDALLVPPKDPAALAEAIERLIKDPLLRERLVESGYRRVEESFAVEQVVAELSGRFEKCGRRGAGDLNGQRKRVLLLTQFFPPETSAGANRIGPMADVLSKYYEVNVVALKPSYPSPEEFEGVPVVSHDTGRPYAVKRTFSFKPHKGSLPLRTLREQAMALRMALRTLSEPVDILVTSSPSMFLGPVGLAVARARSAKFVWDIRDITWGYARDVAGSSPVMTFAARVLERYILYALRRADLVVGASRGITEVLVDGGVERGKAITVPNGISADLLDAIVQRTAGEAENRRPVVAYAGVIGYNQDLGVVLEAARLLPHVDFVLAGDGPELPMLKKKTGKSSVDNVSFTGFLKREELLELYRRSDILIAHVKSSPTIDATMVPVKLFEYMATGRPIVYAGTGAAADLLREIGCAVTVRPGDPEAISAAVEALLGDPERMRILGSRGKVRVRSEFHRDRLMEGLARALEERYADKPNVQW